MRLPADMTPPRPYWRHVECHGCALACKYRDFHVFGRDGFTSVKSSLYVENPDPTTWHHKRRGTVLGLMHAEKLAAWKHHTEACEKNRLTRKGRRLRLLSLAHHEPPTKKEKKPMTEKTPEVKQLMLDTMDQMAVPLAEILIDPKFNVRQTMDEGKVKGLAADIKARGRILQPVIVVRNPNKSDTQHPYKLIVGFRRAEAARLLNVAKVPVEMYEGNELACYATNIAENVQREDLKPFELAQRLCFLRDKFKSVGEAVSGDKIGKLVGISKSYANNLMGCEDRLITPIKDAFHGVNGAECPWGVDKLIKVASLNRDEQRAEWDTYLGVNQGGQGEGAGEDAGSAVAKKPSLTQLKQAIAALTVAVKDEKVDKETAKLAMSCLKFAAGLQKTIPSVYNPETYQAPEEPKAAPAAEAVKA